MQNFDGIIDDSASILPKSRQGAKLDRWKVSILALFLVILSLLIYFTVRDELFESRIWREESNYRLEIIEGIHRELNATRHTLQASHRRQAEKHRQLLQKEIVFRAYVSRET